MIELAQQLRRGRQSLRDGTSVAYPIRKSSLVGTASGTFLARSTLLSSSLLRGSVNGDSRARDLGRVPCLVLRRIVTPGQHSTALAVVSVETLHGGTASELVQEKHSM
jgi:hypothetical protein